MFLDIRCAKCGNGIGGEYKTNGITMIIKISPCEKCAAENKEEIANGSITLQPGQYQQLKDSIPLLKSAMDSLSRRCDEDEHTGALYNINAVIAVLESV